MTEQDFRANAPAVTEWSGLLKTNGVIQSLMLMLIDSAPREDAQDSDPEIVSVRRLSRIEGFHECLRLLYAAATPLPAPPVHLEETWEREEQPQL